MRAARTLLFVALGAAPLAGCGGAERPAATTAAPPVTAPIPDAPDAPAPPPPAPTPAGEGVLHVTTDPAGAMVSVDGRPVGASPVEVTLPAGAHVLTFALANLAFPPRPVDIAADTRVELVVPLRRAAPEAAVAAAQDEATRVATAFDGLRPALLGCLRAHFGGRPGHHHWHVRLKVADGRAALEVLEPAVPDPAVRRCMRQRVEALDLWSVQGTYAQEHHVEYVVE
ncbi:MAG: PEGA domain-containing protein [Myxococcales bacterium]|nr:PEGA domain-containing protein [Myxococcales bacterium]